MKKENLSEGGVRCCKAIEGQLSELSPFYDLKFKFNIISQIRSL